MEGGDGPSGQSQLAAQAPLLSGPRGKMGLPFPPSRVLCSHAVRSHLRKASVKNFSRSLPAQGGHEGALPVLLTAPPGTGASTAQTLSSGGHATNPHKDTSQASRPKCPLSRHLYAAGHHGCHLSHQADTVSRPLWPELNTDHQ